MKTRSGRPGEHVSGWGGHTICLATKYGVAFSECEGEDCPYLPEPPNLWELVRTLEPEIAHASA